MELLGLSSNADRMAWHLRRLIPRRGAGLIPRENSVRQRDEQHQAEPQQCPWRDCDDPLYTCDACHQPSFWDVCRVCGSHCRPGPITPGRPLWALRSARFARTWWQALDSGGHLNPEGHEDATPTRALALTPTNDPRL